ncbi:hypothetical protein THASP1DRAFT_6675, partial [Thamnocephalis sphaerospora]
DGSTSPVAAVQKAITPQSIVAAIICLAVGFILCFFGYRFFRPTLFFAGFCIAALLAYIGCINIAPLTGDDMDGIKRTVYIVVTVVAGFIAGILCVIFWRFGLMIVGALGGLVGALFILALAPDGLIADNVGRALFIVVLTILCAILIFKFERPVVIIATAVAGGFGMALGIDFFVQSEFAASLTAFL